MAVKAGCTAFRKLMKLYPGFTLESCGMSHMRLIDPDGNVVRKRSGMPFWFSNSPRNPDRAAKEIMRDLAELGIQPRRAA